MTKQQLGTLNLVFAISLFGACAGLMIFGDNKTVAIALLPVAFANLTVGIMSRKKSDA